MRVLYVSPTSFPAIAFGGPIHAMFGLCNGLLSLPERHISIQVLTTDAAGPRRDQRLRVASFPTVLATNLYVYYSRRLLGVSVSPQLLSLLPRLVRWADVVHLTGAYSFPTLPTLFLCRQLLKPLVWSP